MNPTLKNYFKKNISKVDKALDRYLPKKSTSPKIIHEAMRYSIFAGGKRLRPILTLAAAEACGGKSNSVLPAACALEMIHTYSLIHDDLPAMDDDDLRRGRPTNHKVYGDDIAILAGDALLTQAFFLFHKNAELKGIKAKNISQAIKIAGEGAGTAGMIGGQVADIKADKGRWKKIQSAKSNLKEYKNASNLLAFVHAKKTAALISTSLEVGGCLVGGSSKKLKALRTFGYNIGMAFQVTDDILDRTANKKKLGKKGSDLKNQKLTYPALYGLEKSQKMAQNYISKAYKSLQVFGKKSKILKNLADFILSRDH